MSDPHFDQVQAAYLNLQPKAAAAIASNIAFLANTTPSNADVVAQVRLLTRECTNIIRLLLGVYDTTDGT